MKEENPISAYLRFFILVLLPVEIIFIVFCTPARIAFYKEICKEDLGKPVLRTLFMAAAKVDFSGRNNKYISRTDLREIKKELRPGDIIFHRNEDQLTNIAISGFWTHTGIYIGGKEEINEFFGNLSITGGKKPSEYIEQKYPNVFRRLVFRRHMIIEAIGQGVSINPIDHFANSDYFSAIRPETDKETLFKVLLAAFGNYGKPYDFFFDFRNDDAFFCSELVYKSLLNAGNNIRFNMPPEKAASFVTPNEIALQATDTSSMFRFVVFYCADENTKKAFRKNRDEFRMYAAF